MLKHFIFLMVASLLVILFFKEIGHFLQIVSQGYYFLVKLLTIIFSYSYLGTIIRKTIALTVLPALVALIPASLYWLLKKKLMPHFYHILWVIWLLLVASLA